MAALAEVIDAVGSSDEQIRFMAKMLTGSGSDDHHLERNEVLLLMLGDFLVQLGMSTERYMNILASFKDDVVELEKELYTATYSQSAIPVATLQLVDNEMAVFSAIKGNDIYKMHHIDIGTGEASDELVSMAPVLSISINLTALFFKTASSLLNMPGVTERFIDAYASGMFRT